ncbi:Alpha/Beta hydrolase protein [Aspergillus pseudoustus]|uniref:Alpha/Beta hydrolase protein n=1 Tax=Aspergillus pseudoustus TaxID=1810923 RepID=A0ABR4ITX7_9EURO
MPLTLHPEVVAGMGPALEALAAAPKLGPDDVAGVRANLDAMVSAPANLITTDPDIQTTTYETPSHDGHIVKIIRLASTKTPPATTTTTANPSPAVLYIHGGGYIHGDALTWTRYIQRCVTETGLPFFAVEYRLAPEHPFPAALEDVYAALKWVHARAADLAVDPARIATFGQSAGGGIAAALGILARDRALAPPIAKQLLIYPELDDRNTTLRPELDALTFWPTSWNVIAWRAYLGADKAGAENGEVSAYAAPVRVTDFSGLPRTYIDIGALDIFREEALAFAAGVAKADVEIEVHVYPGLPHGFDLVPEPSAPARKAIEDRIDALKRI